MVICNNYEEDSPEEFFRSANNAHLTAMTHALAQIAHMTMLPSTASPNGTASL